MSLCLPIPPPPLTPFLRFPVVDSPAPPAPPPPAAHFKYLPSPPLKPIPCVAIVAPPVREVGLVITVPDADPPPPEPPAKPTLSEPPPPPPSAEAIDNDKYVITEGLPRKSDSMLLPPFPPLPTVIE